MKLGSCFVLLAGIAKAANYSKCPKIDVAENEVEDGPGCDEDKCWRQCKTGFVPVEPTKVTCNKNKWGKFKWDEELGGCEPAADSNDDKPTDDKPTDNGDKPDWDGEWGDYGDKPDSGDKPDYGDKPDWDGEWDDDKPTDGDKPDYGDKPDSDGDKPTEDGDKPTDDKPTEDKPTDNYDEAAQDNPGCNQVEMKNGQIKSGMYVEYKLNKKNQFLAKMTCAEGYGTVQGKEDITTKKLICKCSKKTGKCKWKNEKNKKINKAKYQKWKCVPGNGNDEKPTDDKPTGDGDKPGNDDDFNATTPPPFSGRPRILALHGGGGSAEDWQFDRGMQDLQAALGDSVEFVYASAPGNLWMRDPPSKDEPTTDPNWADESIQYLDQFIADHGPWEGLLGYSQGSAFIPIYLSYRPEMQNTFNFFAMYCGYTPTTHQGLMATLADHVEIDVNAMVFSATNDAFVFGAQDQVDVFNPNTVVHYQSQNAGHALPQSSDSQFQNTVEWIQSQLNQS